MNKYRIIKYQNRYIVKVLKSETTTTGHLWWKKIKTTEQYVTCAENGRPLFFSRFVQSSPPLFSFNTLKEAQNKIDVFLSPTEIIKYPNPPFPRDTSEGSYPR